MISLPEDLSYLCAIAIHYGPAWRFWSAPETNRIERHGHAWHDLAQTHQAIAKREDIVAITNWLRSPATTLASGTPGTVPGTAPALGKFSRRQREERRMVRDLLRLFERLGKAGVKPFDQPILRAPRTARVAAGVRPARSGTASKELPAKLHYIVHRARRLGIRPEWDALGTYIDHIDEHQFNALVATAHRMRHRGDDHLLRRWLIESQSSPDDAGYPEAQLARGLLHVLDALDIF